MEMDLHDQVYDEEKYNLYILGSAEVVGLMCLKVFVNGDIDKYNELKPYMKLGSVFKKLIFKRCNADFEGLGRTYFPRVNMTDLMKFKNQRLKMTLKMILKRL